MSDIGSSVPSGDDQEQSRSHEGASSKLDVLVKKLQDTKESTPEPTSASEEKQDRKSRRKPKVTRKVVESEEEDPAIGDIGYEGIEDLLNSMGQEDNSFMSKYQQEASQDLAGIGASTSKEKDSDSVDVDDEGNFILPEGTVVVHPEEVTEDQASHFQGPEFKTTGGRRQVITGDIDNEIIHCTACNKQINTNNSASVKRHPVLKVLICKKCYKWYTSDEIEQDSDGMDEQCRWCGDGGDLLLCDSCNNAFCKSCIRRNLGRKELSDIVNSGDDAKWQCYVCDPKPLASLIHNCTQILKAIEEKEKENASRLEKAKKEKEEKVKLKPEAAATSSSGTRQVAMKSTSKPARMHNKGALQTANVNVARSGKQTVAVAQAKPAPVAVTQGGVTYLVQQPGGTIPLVPQPGVLFQAQGGKLVPVQAAQVGTRIAAQQVRTHGTVQPQNLQQIHTVIAEQWNINEMNVDQVLEKVLAATQSMNMLLYSLREDMKKKTNKAPPNENLRVRKEIAHKFRRAMQAYKKSFLDISQFSLSKSQKVQKKVVPQRQQPQPTIKKRPSQGAKHGGNVEIIELSDSDDGGHDTTSRASASSAKSSLSSKTPVSSSTGQQTSKPQAAATSSTSNSAKKGNLPVAVFQKGSLRKSKTDKDDTRSDASTHNSSPCKSKPVSEEENMDSEVTEIDLDVEQNDTGEKDPHSNSVTDKDKHDSASDNNNVDAIKTSSASGKNDSDSTMREPSPTDDTDIKTKSKDEESSEKDALFDSNDSEPLFDPNLVSKGGKRPASEIEDELSYSKKNSKRSRDIESKPAKRSREDIEAQRRLHKELIEEASTSDEDADTGTKSPQQKSSSSSENSSSDRSDKKKNDEDYEPEKDKKSQPEKSNRAEKQKRKSENKFKDFRVARRKQIEKQKLLQASDSEDALSEEVARKKRSPKKNREKSERTNKAIVADDSDTERKRVSQVNSSSNSENTTDRKQSKSKPKLKECSIRIKRMESGDLCVDNSKSNSTKKIKKSKSEHRDRSDGSNTSMYELDDEIDRLAKVPVVKHKGKPKEESADKDLKSHKVSLEDRRKMAKDKIQDMDAKGKLTRKTPVKQKGKKNGIEDLSSGEEPSDADEEAEDGAGINGNDSNENAGSEQNNRADNSSDENERAKRALLADDSSDDSDDSDFERTKITRKGAGGARPKKDDDDYAPDEDEEEDASTKKKLLTTKLLQAKISDSDSDLDLKPKKRKKKKDTTDEDVTESEPDFSSSSDDNKKQKKKKGKGKKKRDDSSESDSESSGKKKKGKGKKRKRRAKMATDSSAQSGSGSGSGDGDTPGKKRKKIRKVIKDKKLRKETKDAAKAEEERRERIKERQKQFNQVTVADENSPTKCPQTTKLVLDINDKTKETLIEVYPSLIKKLKPHQVEAVKFLWNCCCESVERMRKEEGAGCILAHCMGLGKTLSTISFVHTLLHNSKRTKMKTALILCPLNTVLNWVNEWTMWFEEDEQFDIYELSNVKDNFTRAAMLKDWQQGGGICIMGYEMYRNLKNHRNVKSKKQKVTFTETLVDPGPDVVVCDEGHILKNADSALSKAINQVKTRRRVVLTGTPLQNNLNEYHCMVDFVKPNLLGTKKEFSNRFTHPISNGQSSDATPRDVKLMQRRAHVLHETLAGCVQRKDYTALTKYLMPKHEYIVSVRLTPVQIKLYEEYLRRNFGGEATVRGGRLFSDYQALMRIWTHPWILKLDEIRQENKRMYDDESSFLDDESMTSEGSFSGNSKSSKEGSDDVVILSEDDDAWKPKGTTKRTRAKAGKKEEEAEPQNEVVSTWKTKSRGGGGASVEEVEPEVDKKVSNEWWSEYVDGDSKRDLTLSGKIMLLAQILKMCDSIGDKVLVFSQSLLSLDLIEDFLEHWDSCQSNETEDEKNKEGALMSWTKGGDYFRMDGSTSASLRQTWCDSFNDPENPRARLFLISTKAGSLGINLVAANRVIVFDASWNPTHDIQSIFRVYRFGQTKPVYVYRFLAQGTMEEKIYERQVTKQSLAQRVVDEHQIDRHFTSQDLSELYVFRPDRLDDPNREERPTPKLPKDRLLAELLTDYPDLMVNYHEHDSLLENRPEQDLSEEERKAAWEEYEAEKKGILRQAPQANYGMPQAAYGNAGLAQMMQMQQQMQQSRYNMGSVTQSQYQTQVYSDAQQIASTIYMQNPGIDQDELQARVAQYVQMRLQNENQLYMRQAQTHQQIQQRDKQIEQEIQKLRDMEIERQRQQQQMMNLLKSGRGPVNLLNTMMADPSTSTRGETSGASSNGNSKSKSNK